jgi:hypothetical protein
LQRDWGDPASQAGNSFRKGETVMIETMNMPRRATNEARQHSEGKVARTIEEQTAKLPSDVFLWAALGSMGTALALHVAGKKATSLFVGQWAAPFLVLGLYNKIVKVAGSDRVHDQPGLVT